MSSFTIGDDLRGVLEDVAKSKKQRLFAGNYFKSLHTAFDAKVETVGVATPGLSSAERELVTMHRRELSMCLLQGFYAHFFAGPIGVNPIAATEEATPLETRKQNTRFARDFAPTESLQERTTLWLHRLLENEPITRYEDFLSLSAAAIRLDDSPYATLYQGYAHYSFNRLSAAASRFTALAHSAPFDIRLPALRSLQAVAFEKGSAKGATLISLNIISTTSAIGLVDELVTELGRLATSRLIQPAMSNIKLPPRVPRLARELSVELRMEALRIDAYAPDSFLLMLDGPLQAPDLVDALTQSNS